MCIVVSGAPLTTYLQKPYEIIDKVYKEYYIIVDT